MKVRILWGSSDAQSGGTKVLQVLGSSPRPTIATITYTILRHGRMEPRECENRHQKERG